VQKHYYWDPEHEQQIGRNFELSGAKQLGDMFSRAHKKTEKSSFVSLNNYQMLQKYWKTREF